MNRHAEVAAMFDQLADSYDQVGVDFFQPIADGLVQALQPRAGERVLDIGCGRGAALLRLAVAVGPTGTLTGLDLSPAMVSAADAALVAAGYSGEVLVADAADPPLPAASFDVVASSLVLFFLSDPGAALRSWRELLRPGGRLGISTFGPIPASWRAVDAVFDPYLPPQLLDARTSGAAGPFASDAGVAALVADAGLTEVSTHTITVPVRFSDGQHWYDWTWSTGQRKMWQFVPEDQRAAVFGRALELLEATKDSEGRIGFDQPVRYTLGIR
jgi:ubiquinone/menaquinone biosynthesis C-methylase UbiE